ncbi:MAG: DoxX family protein, partial [bacterium]
PAFVLVGLFTRWAALPAVVTMAVAAFVAHAGDPFGDREMALVYLVMFATVALTGPGRFSIDAHRP